MRSYPNLSNTRMNSKLLGTIAEAWKLAGDMSNAIHYIYRNNSLNRRA